MYTQQQQQPQIEVNLLRNEVFVVCCNAKTMSSFGGVANDSLLLGEEPAIDTSDKDLIPIFNDLYAVNVESVVPKGPSVDIVVQFGLFEEKTCLLKSWHNCFVAIISKQKN